MLKLPDVAERTTLSRSMIYKLMNRGEFPSAVNIGGRAVAWRENDIDDWLEAREPARQVA
jgi:prophage regulatory protein